MAEETEKMMNDVNLADIVAMMNNNGGFGGNNGMTWIIFLFFLMAWGGNGVFGNNGYNSITRTDLSDSFNFQDLSAQLRGISTSVADGFCNLNNNNLQALGTLQNQLTANSDAIASTVNLGLANIQQEIMANRYESMKNTADIISNSTQNTQRILDTINANQVQQLRDELSMTRNTLSNTLQTQNLLNSLQPVPRPSYITNSPYVSSTANFCGCGT